MKPRFLAVMWTVLAANMTQAGELPTALSLEAASSLGVRENPTYRLAQLDVQRSRASRLGVEPWLPANPTFSGDAGPRDLGDRQSTSYQSRLEQRIDLPGQRSARLEAADAATTLAQSRADAVATEIRGRVRFAYMAAQVAARRAEFAAQEVDFLQRAYDAAEVRVETGAASEIDRRLAEVELGRARIARSQASTDHQRSLHELRALLNLPHDRVLVLTTALSPPAPRDILRPQLQQAARERRRDLLALRQEGKAIDAEIERLRMERLPTVALTFNLEQDASNQSWFGPGVVLSPPVWQRQQGPLAVARTERQRQRFTLDVTEQAAARELSLACDLIERRRHEVQLYETSILAAAERSRDLVFDGWRSGKFDIFRALLSERELVNARLGYLDSLLGLWIADIEIDRALGVIEQGES